MSTKIIDVIFSTLFSIVIYSSYESILVVNDTLLFLKDYLKNWFMPMFDFLVSQTNHIWWLITVLFLSFFVISLFHFYFCFSSCYGFIQFSYISFWFKICRLRLTEEVSHHGWISPFTMIIILPKIRFVPNENKISFYKYIYYDVCKIMNQNSQNLSEIWTLWEAC